MHNSSLQKAAVILKSLPKSQAAKILSRLETADLKTVFDALDRVDVVSSNQICDAMMALESSSDGKLDRRESAHDENGQLSTVEPLGRRKGEPHHRPFDFLVGLDAEDQTKLLENEHPKSISDVVSQLDPKAASKIVGGLEPALRVSVLRRLCSDRTASLEDLAQLSYALKLRLKKLITSRNQGSSGVDLAANILSVSDENTKREVIDYLEQQDPELAHELDSSVTRFVDLEECENEEIRNLLTDTDTTLWAPALKNASLNTRRKILDNMAERAAALLSEEISTIGPIDDSIADRAQQEVIQQLLALRKRKTKRLDESSAANVFPSVTMQPSIIDPIFIKTKK